MVHTERRGQLEISSAPLRALHSLGRRDTDALRNAVGLAGGGWNVEQHDDYEGYRSILLTRDAGHHGSSFLVSGRVDAVELALVDGDEITPLGAFASVRAAVRTLTVQLEAFIKKVGGEEAGGPTAAGLPEAGTGTKPAARRVYPTW